MSKDVGDGNNNTTIDTKHEKYFQSYKPNDIFWGIGIENENYLELPTASAVSKDFLLNNHKSERYSVDYYKSYFDGAFNKSIQRMPDPLHKDGGSGDTLVLPILINAHYLTKCDKNGEHLTIYSDNPKQNPKFSGRTNLDAMKAADPWFKIEEDHSYCFDGDTIEFMTLSFYKTTIDKVISELINTKTLFLKKLLATGIFKDLPESQQPKWPEKNHGFARMLTNKNNLAIFNNATYHFNFTMPTLLDDRGEISDFADFEIRHRKAIRLIQFMEPFFIAKYGSPDPLIASKDGLRYPRGSQRCAASRYIGVGTFDTSDTKPLVRGKQLQETIPEYPATHWYTQLYQQINYKKSDKIGFDINFNKFKNHGIEIRFFDWFPEKYLPEVLRTIVHLLDLSVISSSTPYNPTDIDRWHNITCKGIHIGAKASLTRDDLVFIQQYLGIKTIRSLEIGKIYDEIAKSLEKRFGTTGPVSKYMLPQQQQTTLLVKLFSAFSFGC